jgi:hypothetical protein
MAGDELHVGRIVGLRKEHHVGGGIQDAAHQLVQIGVHLWSRIRRRCLLRDQRQTTRRHQEG